MKLITNVIFYVGLLISILLVILAGVAHPDTSIGQSVTGKYIPVVALCLLLLTAIWQIYFIPKDKRYLFWPLAIFLLLTNTFFTIHMWNKGFYSIKSIEYATFTTVQSPKPGGLDLQPLMDSCEYCILKTDEPKAFKYLQTSTSEYQINGKEIDISASVSYSLKDCRSIFQEIKLNDWEVFQIDTSNDSLRTTYHLKRPVTKKKWNQESMMLIPITEEYYFQEDFFDPNSYFKEFIKTLRLKPENFPTNEYLKADPITPNPSDMDKYIYERWTGRPKEENTKIEYLTPNYAGHLHAFVTGCGTNCKTLNFIDLRNGKHLESLTIDFSCGMSEDSPQNYSPKHNVNSRLLVVPCVYDSEGEGFHYFEYIDGRMVKLKSEKWDTDWNRKQQ